MDFLGLKHLSLCQVTHGACLETQWPLEQASAPEIHRSKLVFSSKLVTWSFKTIDLRASRAVTRLGVSRCP